ncbi:MAG: sulfatase-like hydrolase/transferase [Prevotella sp.]|nr:sulfatase-like hydrolase/transferase [Prevotella sp.]
MKQLLNKTYAPLSAVLWNLLLVFIVYQVARLEYYLENINYLSYDFEIFRGGLLFDTSAILYTNVVYVVMMLFPYHKKENKLYHQICKWLYLSINSLALASNLMDSVYFQYTMRRTTTTVFEEFSNEQNLGGIIGTELLHHWYLVLLFILLVAAWWKLYAKPQQSHQELIWWRYDLLCLASLFLFTPFCIAGMRGGFTTAVRPITISNANQYANRPIDAALVLNTPFSLIRTIGKSVFIVPHYYNSEQELEAVYSPIHTSSTTLSSSTRKNIVILIVESFGREYIGALNKDLEGGRYKGYTPCVDSLISHSTTFRYSFCNGRKSIDGMPSILSSIPMFVEPFILTPASMNDYTGLAGILGAEGYETAFFHGAQNGSMGFQAFAQKTGFQHYYGRTEYEATKGTSDFDGTWAIWDEPFLQYYAEEMGRMKEPFMTAVFTASSHHPFVVPEKYKAQFPEEHLEIQKCIRYTDMSIGKFFETASRQPWYENTIFILTSDHTNMSDHAEYQTDLGGFCSPIIIFEPSNPIGEVQDKIAQQIDILPTVLGKLGYPKKYFGFGIDVLNTPKEDTWAVNYLNGIYQYVKNGYVLQFDGQRTKGLYALTDSLMQHNLIHQPSAISHQPQMEKELKAIIQQYMERMTQNALRP